MHLGLHKVAGIRVKIKIDRRPKEAFPIVAHLCYLPRPNESWMEFSNSSFFLPITVYQPYSRPHIYTNIHSTQLSLVGLHRRFYTMYTAQNVLACIQNGTTCNPCFSVQIVSNCLLHYSTTFQLHGREMY